MSNVKDSSFHNNIGRRMMSPELEDHYPWEEIKSSSIDICRAFIKLCVVKDSIWEKITCELEEPYCNTHVDECMCCQIQHMMEENMYALRKDMGSRKAKQDVCNGLREKASIPSNYESKEL
ncbi:hypothetical protein Tco_0558657 [Tanacetum coccineum]